MPSIDSDGIPSMVGISEDYPTDSEAEHGGKYWSSDQAHTSFWCAVRTLTRTELWKCADDCTRTTSKNQFFLNFPFN